MKRCLQFVYVHVFISWLSTHFSTLKARYYILLPDDHFKIVEEGLMIMGVKEEDEGEYLCRGMVDKRAQMKNIPITLQVSTVFLSHTQSFKVYHCCTVGKNTDLTLLHTTSLS